MHGYALKQLLSERAADFAKIKMSNIYYHFEKMEKQGLVQVSLEKEGRRPDRQVYSITPEGGKTFLKLLSDALNLPFDFESIMDGSLFFSEYINNTQILEALGKRIHHLSKALEHIDTHKLSGASVISCLKSGVRLNHISLPKTSLRLFPPVESPLPPPWLLSRLLATAYTLTAGEFLQSLPCL